MPSSSQLAHTDMDPVKGPGSQHEALVAFLKKTVSSDDDSGRHAEESAEDWESVSGSEESGSGGSESDSEQGSDSEGGQQTPADRAPSSGNEGPSRKRERPADLDRPNGKHRRKRRNFYPTIRANQKCGHCHTCLNPRLKKACLTRRAEMAAAQAQGQGNASAPRSSSSSDGTAARHTSRPAAPRSSTSSPSNQLLATLQSLIDNECSLKSSSTVPTFLQLLQSPACNTHTRKLACIVIERSSPTICAALTDGGILRSLSTWLEAAAAAAIAGDVTLLQLLLDALLKLPVNRQLLADTGIGRQLGSVIKSQGLPDGLKQAATKVKDTWLSQVKSVGSEAAPAAAAAAAGGSSSSGPTGDGAPPAKKAKVTQEAVAPGTSTAAGAATAAAPAAGGGAGAARAMKLVSDDDIFSRPRPKVAAVKPATAGVKRPLSATTAAEPAPHGAPAEETSSPRDAAIRCSIQVQPLPEGASDTAAPLVKLVLEYPRAGFKPESAADTTAEAGGGGGGGVGSGSSSGAAGGSTATKAGGSRGVMELLQRVAGGGGASTTKISGMRTRVGSGDSVAARATPPPGGAAAAANGRAGSGSSSKKRVVWRDDRGGKLVSIRWFFREDPAVAAAANADVSEAQQRALAARHSTFDAAVHQEHAREKEARLKAQQDHAEARKHWRAQIETMQAAGPWAEPPRAANWDAQWGIAAGEDSNDAREQERAAATNMPVPMGVLQSPREPPMGHLPDNRHSMVPYIAIDTETTRNKVQAAFQAGKPGAAAAATAAAANQPPPPPAVAGGLQQPAVAVAANQQQQQPMAGHTPPPPAVAGGGAPAAGPPVLDAAALATLAHVVQLTKQQAQPTPMTLPDGIVGYAAGLGVSPSGGALMLPSGAVGLAGLPPVSIAVQALPHGMALPGPPPHGMLAAQQQHQQGPMAAGQPLHPPPMMRTLLQEPGNPAQHHHHPPPQQHWQQQQPQQPGHGAPKAGGGSSSGNQQHGRQGGHRGRVCRFFSLPRGCNKGDTCDFAHLDPHTGRDVRDG